MSDKDLGQRVRLADESNEAYSANNPLPVSMEESEGDEIANYQVDADVTKDAGAVANHEYTVTALKTFALEQVIFGASGRAKIEIQVETAAASGIFDTIAVGYLSPTKLSDEITFRRGVKVAEGVKVRIAKTNLDNQDQDIHSTIVGLEKTA